jgi:hypothetical protein
LKALPILTRLAEKARLALANANDGGATAGDEWAISVVKGEEEECDELSIFAGHTRFVSKKGCGGGGGEGGVMSLPVPMPVPPPMTVPSQVVYSWQQYNYLPSERSIQQPQQQQRPSPPPTSGYNSQWTNEPIVLHPPPPSTTTAQVADVSPGGGGIELHAPYYSSNHHSPGYGTNHSHIATSHPHIPHSHSISAGANVYPAAAEDLAELGLASRDSRLDERWSSFMADSGLLEGIDFRG